MLYSSLRRKKITTSHNRDANPAEILAAKICHKHSQFLCTRIMDKETSLQRRAHHFGGREGGGVLGTKSVF